MAFDREAAKAEGYSDDEINAYLQAEAEKQKQTAPTVDVGEPPAPQTKIEPVGSSAASVGTSAGLAVAPYAIPLAGAAAAGLGGSKLYSGWREGVNAANEMSRVSAQNAATHAATQEMKTLRQIAQGSGPEADAARQRLTQLIQSRGGAPIPSAGPVNPNMPQAGQQAFQQMGQQLAGKPPVAPVAPTPMQGVAPGPVAPTGMPAPTAQAPGVMAQLRAFAANKILPAAGNMARGSVGPAMLFHSGALNANEEEELRKRRMMQPTITR